MNFLDIILLALAAFFTARGLLRGFVKEIISLGSLGLGYFIASHYHGVLDPHIAIYLSNQGAVRAMSFLIVFAAVVIACWMVSKLIREFLEVAMLSWLDKGAGGFFGFVEGLFLCVILILSIRAFAPHAAALEQSRLLPYLEPAVNIVSNITPDDVRRTLEDNGIPLPDQTGN